MKITDVPYRRWRRTRGNSKASQELVITRQYERVMRKVIGPALKAGKAVEFTMRLAPEDAPKIPRIGQPYDLFSVTIGD